MIHSQCLRETPLSSWVAIKEDGEVICAHCSCMAGLGEVCSHVSAVLFAVDTGVRIRTGGTCTSVAYSWLAPSSKSIQYDDTANIDFRSPAGKLKQTEVQTKSVPTRRSCPLKRANYQSFYESLNTAGKKSVVCR